VVERASVDEIFYEPKHPYTRSLLRSIPRIGAAEHTKLETIKGSIPDPYVRVPGCTFHPRCPDFMPGVCDTVIPVETVLAGPTQHSVRCHLYDKEPGSGIPVDPTESDGAGSTAGGATSGGATSGGATASQATSGQQDQTGKEA
jgi:peptide/nickel transport system ATP-binding protein